MNDPLNHTNRHEKEAKVRVISCAFVDRFILPDMAYPLNGVLNIAGHFFVPLASLRLSTSEQAPA
jgi:hypothetical protein